MTVRKQVEQLLEYTEEEAIAALTDLPLILLNFLEGGQRVDETRYSDICPL